MSATSLPIAFVNADHRGLRGGVGAGHRVAFLAGDRRDVDDAAVAVLAHLRDGGPVGVEDAVQVDRVHALPLVVGHVDGVQRVAADAGRAHKHVETRQRGDRRSSWRESRTSSPFAMSNTWTSAPPARSRSTVAAPMPLAPPVTSAADPRSRSGWSWCISIRSWAWPSTQCTTIHWAPSDRIASGPRRADARAARRCTATASTAGELRATPETLRLQADVAAAGRAELAANFRRAAELAPLPDETILAVYTALRPRARPPRSSRTWAGSSTSGTRRSRPRSCGGARGLPRARAACRLTPSAVSRPAPSASCAARC